MIPERPGTIILIHGAWLTPASWDGVRQRYEALGYTVLTPAWPHFDRPAAELRRNPPAEIAGLSIAGLVDHYAAIVRGLAEPPIIIGHSYGGLFAMLLLDRGLGRAGVAICPAPARGIVPTPLTLQSALPVFTTWASWSRVVTMTPRHFAHTFVNGLPPAEQQAVYERQAVPTAGRLFWQGAFGIGNGVWFRRSNRAPLLLITGEDDRTVDPAMVRATYRKYARSPAVTELKAFAGRPHWIIGAPGWEEVADYALGWATSH